MTETHALTMTTSSVIGRPRKSEWPAIPMDVALAHIEREVIPGPADEVPTIIIQPGVVLADKLISRVSIPRVRTSIKDGYAVIANDGVGNRQVITCTTAGSHSDRQLIPGTCARVSTGSMIPEGADAVVQVEDTELVEHDNVEERVVRILKAPVPGQDIRPVGCDMFPGQLLLERNAVIGSAEVGIVAASGVRTIEIYQKPKVCVISTGNELVDWNNAEVPIDRIRDTNRPQLMALLNSLGFEAIDGGIVGDDRQRLVEAMEESFKFCSVLVMSGGVSMGEKDLVKSVLQQDFGFKIHFGRVFMKPGLPSTFASGTFKRDRRYVFALPGNPVSSWVACHLFAVPALRRIAGYQNMFQFTLRVRLAEAIKLDPRPEYRRAWLSPSGPDVATLQQADIPWAVCTSHNQVSSFLLSTRGANLLLRLPPKTEEQPTLQAGDVVDAVIIGPL